MSFEVSPVKVTDQNKAELVSMMTNMYNSEGCGICQKPGGEVFWFSPYSRCAHAKCFELIKTSESDLIKIIDGLFKNTEDYGEKNSAHIKAIKAVRAACNSETIMSYLEKNGVDALTRLFNTVGAEAAKKYASKL
jgi:hypothetical protein